MRRLQCRLARRVRLAPISGEHGEPARLLWLSIFCSSLQASTGPVAQWAAVRLHRSSCRTICSRPAPFASPPPLCSLMAFSRDMPQRLGVFKRRNELPSPGRRCEIPRVDAWRPITCISAGHNKRVADPTCCSRRLRFAIIRGLQILTMMQLGPEDIAELKVPRARQLCHSTSFDPVASLAETVGSNRLCRGT